MAEEISKSVVRGLKLSKRIYYGKGEKVMTAAPKVAEEMERSLSSSSTVVEVAETHMPTGPMVYGVITEPSTVDNPDIPSYQPYVHGRCEPPALIPLHMHGMEMEVDCYMDKAFVTVSGTWRVHCVTASKCCDCRIAVPMGEQGSVLGVEVKCPTRSYSTQLLGVEEIRDSESLAKAKDGFLLKRLIYTIQVPQVSGGSIISVKVSWSQKLLYQNGRFCLYVPFSFPPYVNPVGKRLTKTERITLNVTSGTGNEVTCECASHPLKLIKRLAGKLEMLYEREVATWSTNDFKFSYTVSSSQISGSLFLQSPTMHDTDQRNMFCFYLFPGKNNCQKVFRKEVVYLIDISASMLGGPLENVKAALLAALSNLNPADTFNIITFNDKLLMFSTSLEMATKESIENATQWINTNFMAEGGTNISAPLNQAIKMMSKSGKSIPLIFLITDGAVEDEKEICEVMRGHLMKGGLNCPRICTFGIGTYCNHYFLQMLAQIGRGYYDAAFDSDSINFRTERLLQNASSVILADVKIDALKHLDSLELYPFQIPDLLSGEPLIVSGRYHGEFPDKVKFSGTLSDLSNFVVNAKVQKAKDMPIERVFARRQIDTLTAHAWFSGNKDIEKKVSTISLRTRVPSEYTSIILVETDKEKQASKTDATQEKTTDLGAKKTIFLRRLGVGFGNLKATAENLPLSAAEPRIYETSEMIFKAASTCCNKVLDCCCCMCFIQFCNVLSDRCAITLTQLCAALACFECLNICYDVCSCD